METLMPALESLRRQTFTDFEALILDNSSPPEAREAIARSVAEEPRWSLLRSDQRLPMFDNFQRGVDAAGGRYIAFLHDDDIYREDFLRAQVGFLDAHPAVAFAGSNCTLIDAAGRVIGERRLISRTEAWTGKRYIETLFALGSNVFVMQTVMFRRDLLDRRTFASQGEHFSDFAILMRLAETHDVGLIVDELLQMRTHDRQASRRLDAASSLELRTAVFTAYCDELLARRPERRAEVERLRRLVRRARRNTAVWTWLNASDASGAIASRNCLSRPGIESWLRRTLMVADSTGIGRLLRTEAVRTRIRSAGQALIER